MRNRRSTSPHDPTIRPAASRHGCKVLLSLMVTALAAAAAPEPGLAFRGSMYADLGAYHARHRDRTDQVDFRGITLVGLNFQNINREYGKIEGSVDLVMPHGLYLKSLAGTSIGTFGNLDTMLNLLDKAPLLVDVRKLYLSVYLPWADLTLGRQVINFGTGYLFSPVDVFSRVEVTDLNFRRSGSDVAMGRVALGALSGIDAVVELPFLDRTHSSAVKLFTSVEGWDVSVVGIYRTAGTAGETRETVVGGAFKGDLELGIHGEAAVSLDSALRNPSLEAMAGADYSIGERIVLMAEYLYREHGRTGSPWGEHTAFASAQLIINDLTNVSGSIIHDFQHERTIATVQYFYNLLQNVNFIAYVRGCHELPPYDGEYAARVEVKF